MRGFISDSGITDDISRDMSRYDYHIVSVNPSKQYIGRISYSYRPIFRTMVANIDSMTNHKDKSMYYSAIFLLFSTHALFNVNLIITKNKEIVSFYEIQLHAQIPLLHQNYNN